MDVGCQPRRLFYLVFAEVVPNEPELARGSRASFLSCGACTVNDDGLSQLRSSRQRSPALRIAQGPPHPRLVEGPPPAQVVAPETRRSSLWQLSLSGIPIIASLVSTSLLAYFVLSVQSSQPFAQLQQEAPQQLAQKAPEQPNPQGGQAGAAGGAPGSHAER